MFQSFPLNYKTGKTLRKENVHVAQHENDNICWQSLCGICGAFSQNTVFGQLSCVNCCEFFQDNVKTGACTKFSCSSLGHCIGIGCEKCHFNRCIVRFSQYPILWNRSNTETLFGCRDWWKIEGLLRKYDYICAEWRFTEFPFIDNGIFNWTLLINNFTVLLRRLTTFGFSVKEFQHLKKVQQCKQLQGSLSILLVLQYGLFYYETYQGFNLSPVARKNSNILIQLFYRMFSQPDFTVCRNFLNRMWELKTDRYIFIILTIVVLINMDGECKCCANLNTSYVTLLMTYIRLKYKDPGSSFMINFYTLKALQELQDGMKKITLS